ncbi:sensor histidine kinase [Paractinoplanes hotanensis]|uniref:histidine kinase n=1 Tax=Paractinoplanes hotanensis TaxID=2906497 RepID=A0ABT0Y9V8_9ACTN|nr:ATP-binding protein [Actinoplanes hotanensis]MCM4082829.1 ATP-binding protein [Actinoplanes hotanensis]
MSFRLRIFVLVLLVASTAIGATAWLTLKLGSREVSQTLEAQSRHRTDIIAEIQRYGVQHGRWPGVDRVVGDLAERTGLHIQLQTAEGEVLVDSDIQANRPSGPVQPVAYDIDPLPVPRFQPSAAPASQRLTAGLAKINYIPKDLFGPDQERDNPAMRTLKQAAQYRAGLVLVRCLGDVAGSEPALGLESAPYVTRDQLTQSPECLRKASERVLGDDYWFQGYWDYLVRCERLKPGEGMDVDLTNTACLRGAFNDTVVTSTAVPLLLYLGGRNTVEVADFGRPALLGAAGLLIVALAGTFLIARQVSRPVRRLTGASILLAAGQHDVRVRDEGHGELAQLSRSFNTMARAVQESEERQRRLVADVAHEMRTPLSNLRGYLEGLADGVIEPSRELFASLHEETMLQRRILDDLQVLALAEAGDLGYTRTPTDLAELAAAGVTAQLAVAATAGVTLEVEAAAPVWVSADQDRMRQVLGNLLTNAIRYTDRGGRVAVRARAEAGEAVLSVEDTGVGIAPGDVPHVFERFWRADPARQRATGGSGLGLTIAQRIVTDHGGRIEVVSRPHLGTTFTVRFPLS